MGLSLPVCVKLFPFPTGLPTQRIDVDVTRTVAEFEVLLYERLQALQEDNNLRGVPQGKCVELKRFLFSGKVLDRATTLTSCDVQKECTIQVLTGLCSQEELQAKKPSKKAASPSPTAQSATATPRRVPQVLCLGEILVVKLLRGEKLIRTDFWSRSADPYVVLSAASTSCKSRIVTKCRSPEWDETFVFYSRVPWNTLLHVDVFDHNIIISDDFMGTADFAVNSLPLNRSATVRLQLQHVKRGTLSLHLHRVACTSPEMMHAVQSLSKLNRSCTPEDLRSHHIGWEQLLGKKPWVVSRTHIKDTLCNASDWVVVSQEESREARSNPAVEYLKYSLHKKCFSFKHPPAVDKVMSVLRAQHNLFNTDAPSCSLLLCSVSRAVRYEKLVNALQLTSDGGLRRMVTHRSAGAVECTFRSREACALALMALQHRHEFASASGDGKLQACFLPDAHPLRVHGGGGAHEEAEWRLCEVLTASKCTSGDAADKQATRLVVLCEDGTLLLFSSLCNAARMVVRVQDAKVKADGRWRVNVFVQDEEGGRVKLCLQHLSFGDTQPTETGHDSGTKVDMGVWLDALTQLHHMEDWQPRPPPSPRATLRKPLVRVSSKSGKRIAHRAALSSPTASSNPFLRSKTPPQPTSPSLSSLAPPSPRARSPSADSTGSQPDQQTVKKQQLATKLKALKAAKQQKTHRSNVSYSVRDFLQQDTLSTSSRMSLRDVLSEEQTQSREEPLPSDFPFCDRFLCHGCNRRKPYSVQWYVPMGLDGRHKTATDISCRDCQAERLRRALLATDDDEEEKEDGGERDGVREMFITEDVKALLNADEYRAYLDRSFEEFMKQHRDDIAECPACSHTVMMDSHDTRSAAVFKTKATGVDGQALSEEAQQHFLRCRVLCRKCDHEFCRLCKQHPYHVGFDCDGFVEWRDASKCRFCNGAVLARLLTVVHDSEALKDVCHREECQDVASAICTKRLQCGHFCNGIKDESVCLPCFRQECSGYGESTEPVVPDVAQEQPPERTQGAQPQLEEEEEEEKEEKEETEDDEPGIPIAPPPPLRLASLPVPLPAASPIPAPLLAMPGPAPVPIPPPIPFPVPIPAPSPAVAPRVVHFAPAHVPAAPAPLTPQERESGVPCPVCARRVLVSTMNEHLDQCLQRSTQNTHAPVAPPLPGSGPVSSLSDTEEEEEEEDVPARAVVARVDCALCHVPKLQGDFSRNQWNRGREGRVAKCIVCLSANNPHYPVQLIVASNLSNGVQGLSEDQAEIINRQALMHSPAHRPSFEPAHRGTGGVCVEVQSGGWGPAGIQNGARRRPWMAVDGERLPSAAADNGVKRGLQVAVLHFPVAPQRGPPVIEQRVFDTCKHEEQNTAFEEFIMELPTGTPVIAAVRSEAAESLNVRGIRACMALGSTMIHALRSKGSWCILGRKGAPLGSVPEAVNNKNDAVMGVPAFTTPVLFARITPEAHWQHVAQAPHIGDAPGRARVTLPLQLPPRPYPVPAQFTATHDDLCSICCTTELYTQPCIRLRCGHVFHAQCARQRLSKQWHGTRVTFSFATCPLCQKGMEHIYLRELIIPLRDIAAHIRAGVTQEQLLDVFPEKVDETDYAPAYFEDVRILQSLLHTYSYYKCSKCTYPFCAGRNECAAALEEEEGDGVEMQNLVCMACQKKMKKPEASPKVITGSKRCPFCNTPITHFKFDGCHHIGYGIGGCPGKKPDGSKCGQHWCYYCLSKWPGSKCKKEHWFCFSRDDCDCPPCPDCAKMSGNKKCVIHR